MANVESALEMAMDLFPEFFDEEKGTIKGLSKEELDRLYLEKRATIKLTMFNGNMKRRLEHLGIGYSYLLNELNNPKTCVDIAFMEYNNLVTAISKYGFVERNRNTNGQNQNKAQGDMMFYVKSFGETLSIIEKYFKDHIDKIETRRADFDELIYRMDEQVSSINEAASVYHNNLLSYRNGGNSASVVGQCRKDWKQEKNRGLQTVMSFVRKMVEIYDEMLKAESKENGIRIKDYDGIPVNVIYWANINRLKKSKVYFSFLTDEEKAGLQFRKKLQ